METTIRHIPSRKTLRERLSGHLSKTDILELGTRNQEPSVREQLFLLLFDTDERVASNAAWVCTHWDKKHAAWLTQIQGELIEKAIHSTHPTQRRLLLTLLYRQQRHLPLHAELLNHCMQRMVSCREPDSIRALCVKLAYAQCRQDADLMKEFRLNMEVMEHDLLPPSLRSVRKYALQALDKNKPFI